MSRDCNVRDDPPCDRISTLSDDIRLRMLALLSRRDAIRTSVLSSHWRNLWEFRYPYNTVLKFMKKYTDEEAQIQFVGEITHCMQLYQDKKIEGFFLSLNPHGQNQDAIKEWIQQATSCGAEEFFLDFSQGLDSGFLDGNLARKAKGPVLTEVLFKDNMIMILHLRYCRLDSTFKFKFFSYLETLYLHGIKIKDAMLEEAIANCKFLRKLNLDQCLHLHCLKVSGPELKLKLLLVANCWGLCSLEISAPNLESIDLIGKFPADCTFIDIPSLVCVNLYPVPMMYYGALHPWMRDMIVQNQVESLSLYGSAIQKLVEHELFQPMMLSNVKILCLSVDKMVQFNVVSIYKLVKKYRFPQLEVLEVQFPAAVDDLVAERFLDALQTEILTFRFERLKSLMLDNFHVARNHVNFLNYILERAGALVDITLVLPFSYRLHESESSSVTLVDALMQQKRASTTARISVIYPTGSGGFASYTSQDDMTNKYSYVQYCDL